MNANECRFCKHAQDIGERFVVRCKVKHETVDLFDTCERFISHATMDFAKTLLIYTKNDKGSQDKNVLK